MVRKRTLFLLLLLLACVLLSVWFSPLLSFVLLPVTSAGLLLLFARAYQQRQTRAIWPWILLGNLLALNLLLTTAFTLGELYFRFVYDSTEASTSTLTSQAWYHRHWHTNSTGWRDNIEYRPSTDPGKRRIFFIGDSFTAGYAVKNVDDRFVNRLRAAHTEWEVYCIAYPGLDTGGEMGLTETVFMPGQRYERDVFVLVYTMNDIEDFVPEWVEGVREISADPFCRSWLFRNSYLINLYYIRWQEAHNAKIQGLFGLLKAAYTGPAWEKQRAQLTEFQKMIHSHGASFFVVTFPDLPCASRSPYEFQNAHDRLNALWSELQVPHLDLLPTFQGLPVQKITANNHDAHPNEFAHALAAQAIDKFLTEHLKEKQK